MPTGPDHLPDDDGTPFGQIISSCAVTLISEAEKQIRNRNQECDDELTPFLTLATTEISAAEDEKAACIDRLRKALEGFQFGPATICAIENRLSLMASKWIGILQITANLATTPQPANASVGAVHPISISSSPIVRQVSFEHNPPSSTNARNTDPDNKTTEQLSGSEEHESDASRHGEVQRRKKASRPARKRKRRTLSGEASQKTLNQRYKRPRKTQGGVRAASPSVVQTELGSDLDDTEFVSINTNHPKSPFVIRCDDLSCRQRKTTSPPFQRNQAWNHFNKKHRGPNEEYQTEEYIWKNYGVKILDVDERWVGLRAKGKQYMCTPKNFVPGSLKKGGPEASIHEPQTHETIESRSGVSPNTITCASELPVEEYSDTNRAEASTSAAQTNHAPGPSLFRPQSAIIEDSYAGPINNNETLYRISTGDAEASFGSEMRDESDASETSYAGSWIHGLPGDNDRTELRNSNENELRDSNEIDLRPFGHEGPWPRRSAPKEH